MPISVPALPFDASLQVSRGDAPTAIGGSVSGVSGEVSLSFASLLAGAAPTIAVARMQSAVGSQGETGCLLMPAQDAEGAGESETVSVASDLPGSLSEAEVESSNLNEHPGRGPALGRRFSSSLSSNPANHPSSFGRSVGKFAPAKESTTEVSTFVATHREPLRPDEPRLTAAPSNEVDTFAADVSPSVDSPVSEIVGIPLVAPTPATAAPAPGSVGLTPTILPAPSSAGAPERGVEYDFRVSSDDAESSRPERHAFTNVAHVSEGAPRQETPHRGDPIKSGKARPQDNLGERATTGSTAHRPADVVRSSEAAFRSAAAPPKEAPLISETPSKDLPAPVGPKAKKPVISEGLVHAGEHASDRALERGRAFAPITAATKDLPSFEPADPVPALPLAIAAPAEKPKTIGSNGVVLNQTDALSLDVSPAPVSSPHSETVSRSVAPRVVAPRVATAAPVAVSKEVGSGLAAIREIDVIDRDFPTVILEATPSRAAMVHPLPLRDGAQNRLIPNVSLEVHAPTEKTVQATEPAFEASWHLGRFLGRENTTGSVHLAPNFAVTSWNPVAASPWITPRLASSVGATAPAPESPEQVSVLDVAQALASAKPSAANGSLVADARAASTSVAVVREKFAAGPVDRVSMAPGERGEARQAFKNSSLIARRERLTEAGVTLGTETATWVSSMHQDFRAARAVPTSEESFSSVSAAAATSTVNGSVAQSSMMESTETVVSSSAVQAVRRVMDAADTVWATERPGMDFKLKFDDVGVAVRVEYRDGTVTATFEADSAGLRERLTAAWQVQTAGLAEPKPYRLSDPVFTSSSSSSNSSSGGFSSAHEQSAGGDTARQFAHSRQPETGNPSPGSSSTRSTPAPAPFAETRPAVLPGTNARLHAFA